MKKWSFMKEERLLFITSVPLNKKNLFQFIMLFGK